MLTSEIAAEIALSGWESSTGLAVRTLIAIIPRIVNRKMEAFIVIGISCV
jgi:hypothetical protein